MIAISTSLPGRCRRPNAQPLRMPITVLIATAIAAMMAVFFITSGMLPMMIALSNHCVVSCGGNQSLPNQPLPTERSEIIKNGAMMRIAKPARNE